MLQPSTSSSAAKFHRLRSHSVNMPLILQDEYRRLQPLQLTIDARVLSHDATVSVITDKTAAASSAAAAGSDEDEDTRDASQYRLCDTPSRSRQSSRVQPQGTTVYTATTTDSLSSIAARHKTTTSELVRINRLMTNMIFPGQMLFVPDEDYILLPDQTSSVNATTTDVAAAAGDVDDDKGDDDDEGEDVFDEDTASPSILFASQAQYLGHSNQGGASVAPVTGMLTVYDDQLRFDIAVDSCSHLADVEETDDCMSCVRIDRALVNSVDISDNAPISRLPSQSEKYDDKACSHVDDAVSANDEDTTTTTTHDVTSHTTATAPATADSMSRDRRKTTWSQSRQATILDFDSQVGDEVRYVTVRLGLVSTDRESEQQDKPTISLLIRSFLPTVTVIQHYFALPTQRMNDVVEVLSSCGLSVTDVDSVTSESSDTVSDQLVSPHQKARVKPVYRRTLSAAELYNLPLPELSHPSNIFTDNHIRTLREHLPARADGRSWLLVYSSDRDGFSLRTLYRKSSAHTSCPVLLIIHDQLLHIFGAMLPCELRLSETFYGNGELFLFTFFPTFKKYGWSGKNCYFIKGNTDSLFVGATDGAFGLWLDDCLYRGRTDRCETFDNDPLIDSHDFIVDCIEAWSFQ